MARYRPVGRFSPTLADHDLGLCEMKVLLACACAPSASANALPGSAKQAGRQLPAERSSSLDDSPDTSFVAYTPSSHQIVAGSLSASC